MAHDDTWIGRQPWLLDLAEEQPLLDPDERARLLRIVATDHGRRQLALRSRRWWRNLERENDR